MNTGQPIEFPASASIHWYAYTPVKGVSMFTDRRMSTWSIRKSKLNRCATISYMTTRHPYARFMTAILLNISTGYFRKTLYET